MSNPVSCRESQFTYVLSFWDGGQVDLDLGHGQNISGSGHVDQKVCDRQDTSAIGSGIIHNDPILPYSIAFQGLILQPRMIALSQIHIP